MKKLLFILFTLIHLQTFSQCVGVQTFTLTPPPPPNGYAPGTVVQVCYKMVGWPGLNVGTNWLEGFDINLGSGWTSLQPMQPPANCNGGNGVWIWLTINYTVSGIVGPGWFFDSGTNGPLDGNAANDWGDSGNCTWQFCFKVKVINNCSNADLLIQVTAGADGDWGSWTNNNCPTIPFTIYNGTMDLTLPTLPDIYHD